LDIVPTIEGSLWKALSQVLHSLKYTAAASSLDLQIQRRTNPKGMTRSSRTDKGVSSLGNVLTLIMPNLSFESESVLVSEINAHLPDDIRLLRAMMGKIPIAFDARAYCGTRRYRYIIPSRALMVPNNPDESIMDLRK
jgi:tRNA pseudouridine(38-40) synthase